jgi:hypothetical protein
MTPTHQEIHKLIERRFRRRLLFTLHFLAFMAAVLATAWWISTHWVYPGDWKNLAYLGGWGALLFVHWLYYNLANGRDREIEAAWERVYGEADLFAEKPKHTLLDNEDFLPAAHDAGWMQDVEFAEKTKRRG